MSARKITSLGSTADASGPFGPLRPNALAEPSPRCETDKDVQTGGAMKPGPRRLRPGVILSVALATTAACLGAPALQAQAAPVVQSVLATQPVPGHDQLVPAVPRNNTPRIANGEIWDIEVVGTHVYIAGSFTSLANTTGNTATFNQPYLASYDINTGLIDRTFRPNFENSVKAVEATPDGTKLFVGGTFSAVNGSHAARWRGLA